MTRLINKIVVHHSITPRDLDLDKTINSFNNTHKERLHTTANSLWYHIAYHYVIWWDWEVVKTRGLDEIWYHASVWEINRESIGICMTGNFDEEKPSEKQLESLAKLIRELQNDYSGLTIHSHNEFSSKTCPWKNVDMSLVNNLVKELSEPTISAWYKNYRLDTSKWVIKYKLMNYTDDMHKYKTIIMLNNAFRYISNIMSPIQYVPTKHTDEADIKIYFAHPWDDILPAPFKEWSLAYGIAPYWEFWGNLYLNDSEDRAPWLLEWEFWLIKVLVHEIWHCHNIWHSTILNDIMYSLYEAHNHEIWHSEDTVKFIRSFYNLD